MVKHKRYRCSMCGKEYNLNDSSGQYVETHWMALHRMKKHDGKSEWEFVGTFLFRPQDFKICEFKLLDQEPE